MGGPGGRLAMRLLAVTAGDAAQGRLTEADQVVGRITTGGTIGFVIFNGVFGGLAAGLVYLVVRRCLPAGRLGAVVYGLALLVVVGTTVDPLRGGNPDFDLVGPGWLAALVFSLVLVAFACTRRRPCRPAQHVAAAPEARSLTAPLAPGRRPRRRRLPDHHRGRHRGRRRCTRHPVAGRGHGRPLPSLAGRRPTSPRADALPST
ncbi:MAG TPA: hypothetical protein VFJ85_16545 [Acidimicrobiales bacterium]|nr:hypothetical protein [Acidimicrobiales bacterium]